MKLIIHAGINPGDTNLLKETLRKNRQGLQAEGLCWGAYKHQDKHKILFNIPKVNHNWIERFTRKAKAAVGDHGAAIIFLDAALLFQSRTNPQDIEKILVKLKIKNTVWTLAFEEPFSYFNQIFQQNLLNPSLQTPFPASYAETARIACKRGFITIPNGKGNPTHIFDYIKLLRKLSASISKPITTFKSIDLAFSEFNQSNAYINWVLGRTYSPKEKKSNELPILRSYEETSPPSHLLTQIILTRKLIKDTGQSYRFNGNTVSRNNLINLIAEQQAWLHKQDIKYAKNLFKTTFYNWEEVLSHREHWGPAEY